MEDIQIVELYFARDESAIRETKNKYGQLCFRIADNIVGIKEDAEECVSDTYWTVWNQIPPTRPRYLAAFLCKIVRNLSLKRIEYIYAQKRTPNVCTAFEELEEMIPDSQLRMDSESEEIGSMISTFLRKEKELTRKVFLRRYFAGDTIAAIAKQYGLRENTVKSILFRTRSRLHMYLKKEGVLL